MGFWDTLGDIGKVGLTGGLAATPLWGAVAGNKGPLGGVGPLAGMGANLAGRNPGFTPGPGSNGFDQFPGLGPDYKPGVTSSDLSQINTGASKPAVDQFTQEAMRTPGSASPWANMANSQQDWQANQARSSAGTQAASGVAQQEGNLAMRGGLDSGARERIQKTGQQNYLDMSQNINRDQAGNKMQIGMNDEQNRISQLSSVPGMQNTAMQPLFQKFGLQGQEAANQNQFNWQKYNTQMGGWAANQQANATQATQKPGFNLLNPSSWF